jgi:hypothetical protein
MSVHGRSAPLLHPRALAIVVTVFLSICGVACGSATLKTDGGAGIGGKAGGAGRAGAGGAGGGGAGGGAVGRPCVLDSTQVDNCILQ